MIKNYSGTPSTKEALLLLIDSYNKMRMYDLAYDTARVFQKNYPDYQMSYVERNVVLNKKIKQIKKLQQSESNNNKNSWYDYLNIFNYF